MIGEFGQWIGGAVQWLIDTIGKLGPLSVAVAVFVANQRHNAWTSGAVIRTANLEDQKMRLALLDRRLAVIEHIRTVRNQLGPSLKGADALSAVLDALREAELIFEDDEQKAINACLHVVVGYQNHYGRTFELLTGDELQDGLIAHQQCLAAINGVLTRLREAARIRVLPPLAAPPKWHLRG